MCCGETLPQLQRQLAPNVRLSGMQGFCELHGASLRLMLWASCIGGPPAWVIVAKYGTGLSKENQNRANGHLIVKDETTMATGSERLPQDPDSWSTRGRIAIQAGPNRDGRLDDLA